MNTQPAETKKRRKGKPIEVVKVGSISVRIYSHKNIIPKRDAQGKILYAPTEANGKRHALIKYSSNICTLGYYEGTKRVRRKSSDLDKASREVAGVIGGRGFNLYNNTRD